MKQQEVRGEIARLLEEDRLEEARSLLDSVPPISIEELNTILDSAPLDDEPLSKADREAIAEGSRIQALFADSSRTRLSG
jgi:hypothetical protein